MNKELNAKVLALVQASGCNEYDQRSALGVAQSCLENKKPVVRDGTYMHLRDDLADALVAAMQDYDPADCKSALQSARAWVNAPFLDPTMNGVTAGQHVPERHRQ